MAVKSDFSLNGQWCPSLLILSSFLGRAMVGENADVYSGPGMGIYPFNARISWLNPSGPDASNGPRGTAWLLLLFDIFDLMSATARQDRYIDVEQESDPRSLRG